mmetsp:Transcript_34298/g.98861  ORF Transcript_34298/g.98861 Transcript_34298/m.98861 type:complete len:241 (-) Transcript_34298:203-925(-)
MPRLDEQGLAGIVLGIKPAGSAFTGGVPRRLASGALVLLLVLGMCLEVSEGLAALEHPADDGDLHRRADDMALARLPGDLSAILPLRGDAREAAEVLLGRRVLEWGLSAEHVLEHHGASCRRMLAANPRALVDDVVREPVRIQTRKIPVCHELPARQLPRRPDVVPQLALRAVAGRAVAREAGAAAGVPRLLPPRPPRRGAAAARGVGALGRRRSPHRRSGVCGSLAAACAGPLRPRGAR